MATKPKCISSDEVKRIDIKEFRALGFLQEINRLVLHPCGLALEVIVDKETGEERLGGVWDYRDDPEGMAYGEGPSEELAENVLLERVKHAGARLERFGWTIQPLGETAR